MVSGRRRKLQINANEFLRRFKSNIKINPIQAIQLSIDIIEVDNDSLTMEVSDEDILEAAKQINLLKTSGPNDMQAIFYHKNWYIIGKFVCNN